MCTLFEKGLYTPYKPLGNGLLVPARLRGLRGLRRRLDLAKLLSSRQGQGFFCWDSVVSGRLLEHTLHQERFLILVMLRAKLER